MAGLQFADLQSRPTEFLDFTRLTVDEFQHLVPSFEAAFQAHMAAWRLDGKPQTARRFTVYQNCPLPTPEDRLLFILAYVKPSALQVVQGRLFSMGQSKANQWIHGLLAALLAALPPLVPSPPWHSGSASRRLTRRPWSHRCEEERTPLTAAPTIVPPSPLLAMTAPNGASSAPKTLLNRQRVRAARKRITR